MRKEVLLAIIIGFTLGFLIVFGVWTANKAIREQPASNQTTVEEEVLPESSSEAEPEGISLKINAPENNTISELKNITVSGTASAGATIAIVYESGEKILIPEADGSWSAEINLDSGSNEITIFAFDEKGNETSQTLVIVYSTAEI